MKAIPSALVALSVFMLAGCAHPLTLDEARALCEKKGGLLMVIYTQQITVAGLGEQVANPGDCISTDKFGVAPALGDSAPVK